MARYTIRWVTDAEQQRDSLPAEGVTGPDGGGEMINLDAAFPDSSSEPLIRWR